MSSNPNPNRMLDGVSTAAAVALRVGLDGSGRRPR
jgi:hypothetical protein